MPRVDLGYLHKLVDTYIRWLPPSSDKPVRELAVIIRVESEEHGHHLARRLERRGFMIVGVESERSLFRRRWQVVARSGPVPYAAAKLREWVDSIASFTQEHGAAFEHWVPLALPDEAVDAS